MFEYSLVPGRRCPVGPRGGYTEPEPAPVKVYKLTPEEIAAKYGPPNQSPSDKKPSPLDGIQDPVVQQLKLKRGGKCGKTRCEEPC